LRDLEDNGVEEVIVFGAGEYGRLFANRAWVRKFRIRCFADSNEEIQGQKIEDCSIVSPTEACSIPHIPFVVTTRSGCTAIVERLSPVLRSDDRLIFTHINSWRSRLACNSALNSADLACRELLREAVTSESPWATAFILCNFRWFVHLWSLSGAVQTRSLSVSPFVYQMQ
jgi:hypothetical protein